MFLFIIADIRGQVSGTIKDQNGIALPYASIYIEGSSTGTVSNSEGYYRLEINKKGLVKVIYQYVGYTKQSHSIDYEGLTVLDVIMVEDENISDELVITADREDPAYNIMRKAIKRRNYFKNQFKSYEADLYVKGLVKITDSPKKILGEEIGDMKGLLDSTGRGIV